MKHVLAIAGLWALGCPLFFWTFDRSLGYYAEDVFKIALVPPIFGIFAFWVFQKIK